MTGKKAKIVSLFLSLNLALNAVYADVRIPERPLCEKLDLDPTEDEVVAIGRLIEHTLIRQQAQIRLKNCLITLRENKAIFMQGEPTKIHARYMIRAAREGLSIIREYRLEHLFSSDFIDELAVLSQVGTKQSQAYE